jgi:hypothetical protein
MTHQFNITTAVGDDRKGHPLRSPITVFQAETELGPSPQLDLPETIAGKLVPSLTSEKLYEFKSKPGVEVSFGGKGYKFSKLERDGSFELSLIEP